MPRWERTHDLRAHRPAFEIKCRFCDSLMMFRYSEVYPEENVILARRNGLNVIEYKCPRCSLIEKFYVEDEREYLQEMLDMRDGRRLYLPPKEEWEAEHEEIKKRLKILGYM